jgi:hypothetical protein
MASMKRALISVSDKTGVVDMAGSYGPWCRNFIDWRNSESASRCRHHGDGSGGLHGIA